MSFLGWPRLGFFETRSSKTYGSAIWHSIVATHCEAIKEQVTPCRRDACPSAEFAPLQHLNRFTCKNGQKMGKMDISSISQLIEDLDAAVLWMAGLGVDVGSGRISTYRAIAAEWAGILRGSKKLSVQELYPRVSAFAYEVPAFLNIYRAFKAVPKSDLALIASQLRKAVIGPWRIEDESRTSPNPARDFLFESLTAAHVHKPGSGCYAILDSPSDTGFVNERVHVYIECKRLSSSGGIEGNIKKASQQLAISFDKRKKVRNRGLIAMDASKLIRPPDTFLETKTNEEIGPASQRVLSKFADDHMEELQRRLRPADRRIIGFMIYFTSVAVATDDQLFVNVTMWTIVRRRNINPSDSSFLARLPSLLAR